MIVDTSALIAILRREPETERMTRAISTAPEAMVSAASLLEATIVMLRRHGEDGVRDLDLLVAKLAIEVVPFTVPQADIARRAYRRYGRGRHLARLNFGDCFAYALAQDLSVPLLFKGDDFSRTDVTVATY